MPSILDSKCDLEPPVAVQLVYHPLAEVKQHWASPVPGWVTESNGSSLPPGKSWCQWEGEAVAVPSPGRLPELTHKNEEVFTPPGLPAQFTCLCLSVFTCVCIKGRP